MLVLLNYKAIQTWKLLGCARVCVNRDSIFDSVSLSLLLLYLRDGNYYLHGISHGSAACKELHDITFNIVE